jgi:SET domain-containing protein
MTARSESQKVSLAPRRRASKNTVKGIVVRPVRNGCGLVAQRAFQPGTFVMPVHGQILTASALWKMWEHSPLVAANCFRYDQERYLSPEGELGAFANHSCLPNAAVFKEGARLVMRAIRPIAPWDEVTHDYSTFLGVDDVWSMRCNCGQKGCRKVVRHVGRLPADVRRRYLALGAIPTFIVQTLDV